MPPDPAHGVIDRRLLLRNMALSVVATVGAIGCRKKPLVCDGLPGTDPADLQLRTTLEYVDISPLPDRECVHCSLYIAAPAEGTCGGCKVVRGPIHPKGTCKVFLQMVEGGAPT